MRCIGKQISHSPTSQQRLALCAQFFLAPHALPFIMHNVRFLSTKMFSKLILTLHKFGFSRIKLE